MGETGTWHAGTELFAPARGTVAGDTANREKRPRKDVVLAPR